VLSAVALAPRLARDIMGVVSNGAFPSVLVGRAGELAGLEAALERVREGRPSAVLIGGEAGVGKSRLAAEFGARARAAGATRVLSGYCLDLSAEGLPFAPFTGVLRELVRELGADGVAALLPGRGTRELARLLPELGEPGLQGDPGEARARMFEQMLALLGRLAEAGPVVLVIEDAHWSDRSTRDLLAFLIGNQQALDGVLIVVTFRSDELHRSHPLRPVLAELGRLGWVARLTLPRLTRREGHQLMARLLGCEPGPELAERVFARSEGNPLFIETLLGSDALLDPGLPESLRDLVLADVQRLPARALEVLEAMAVAGQWCGHGLLAAATGLGDRELLAALRSAVSANVLVPEADGYAFRHALIREAILGQMLPGEKTRLHICLAEALAADPSLVPPGRAVIEQAHHWYSARDMPRALASAWQAADAAGRSLAYAEKLAMLARILELWPTVPDAAQVVGTSHVSVLESAADSAADAGEDELGIGFATAALKEIDATSEPARAAGVLALRAELRWYLGRAEGVDDLREALRLVPADDPGTAVRRRVLSWLATWPELSGGVEARAATEEALRLARQAGDLATEAQALITLAKLDNDEHGLMSLDLLDQARTVAEKAHSHDQLLRVAVNESHYLEGMGEHERAAQVARQGVASAREHGLARGPGTLLAANVAEPLIALGRWDEAADMIEQAIEMSPPRASRAGLLQLAGIVALARGDLSGAARSAAACRGALAGFGYRDQRQLPLALLETRLYLAQDRAGDAVAVAGQAVERFNLERSPRYTWPLLVAGARACFAVLGHAITPHDHGLAERARHLLDQLRGLAEKLKVTGPLEAAHRLTFTAEAARADDPAGAPATDLVAAWDAAAQAWDRLDQPYELACALLRAASAAMDQGDRDGAAQRLARAASLAGRLGAGPLRGQIGSLARRARLGLPSGPPGEQGPGIPGLTARETEVLRLVAAGRSNREIGAELFISAKTVSVHVSNILAKLNAGTRTEAAAIAHRAGLAAEDS
jgi:DNA-binding CsgD family transcriptional regulator/tetratricopeptide (TPR) repeat protein